MDLEEVMGVGTDVDGVVPVIETRQFPEHPGEIVSRRFHVEDGAENGGMRGPQEKNAFKSSSLWVHPAQETPRRSLEVTMLSILASDPSSSGGAGHRSGKWCEDEIGRSQQLQGQKMLADKYNRALSKP